MGTVFVPLLAPSGTRCRGATSAASSSDSAGSTAGSGSLSWAVGSHGLALRSRKWAETQLFTILELFGGLAGLERVQKVQIIGSYGKSQTTDNCSKMPFNS